MCGGGRCVVKGYVSVCVCGEGYSCCTGIAQHKLIG